MVECMKLGAADFVETTIDIQPLRHRIEDLLADDTERARADAEPHAVSRRFGTLSQRERRRHRL